MIFCCLKCNEHYFMFEMVGDTEVCKRCAFTCSICGRHRYLDLNTRSMERGICEQCYREKYFYCGKCNRSFEREYHRSYNSRGNSYCIECFEDFIQCCGCESYYDKEEMYEFHGDQFCQECYDSQRRDIIQSYDYKSEPVFMRVNADDKSILLGVEVEVERMNMRILTTDIADNLLEGNKDIIYCKEDGSLNDGFEVVFEPMSMNWIKQNAERIGNILDQLKKDGCRSYDTDTCGMHVHISKNEISHLTLYKILKLFYENPDFIIDISQRLVDRFNEWSSLEDNENLIMKARTKDQSCERHVAINLSNYDTIEIRIFRGTLKLASFLKNIEFCHSLLIYSQSHSINNISRRAYLKFIKQEVESYPNLTEFLKFKKP